MTEITFLCPPELDGKIPVPTPASKHIPDWFRDLPREMGMKDAHGLPGLTVRACLPVADIMSLGWMLLLPFDLSIGPDPATGQLQFRWADGLPFKPIEPHHPGQIGADKAPFYGMQPLKFINPWRIILPTGWSAAFIHPMNHFELPFITFNASVDCDALDVPVNIPFFWTGREPEVFLPAGTPIAQIIPYERRAMKLTSDVRAETINEAATREASLSRKYGEESVYAREWRRRHERQPS